MEFTEVVRRRRMVRSFDGRPVPPDVVRAVLDAARRGPSAGFSQGQAFLALDDPDQLGRFWASVPAREGVRRAPVVVLVLTSKQAYLARYAEPDKATSGLAEEAAWPVPYWDVDAGAAVMLLLLAAVDRGLGALFFGVFRGAPEPAASFGVPEEYRVVGAVALGYAAEGERSRPSRKSGRRPFEDVVRFNRW